MACRGVLMVVEEVKCYEVLLTEVGEYFSINTYNQL